MAPSTAPIQKASAAISQKQAETKQHIEKAQEIVKTLTISLPEDKIKIDALTAELGRAMDSNDQLKADNDELSQDNQVLAAKIGEQTQKANDLANDYNKLKKSDDKAQAIVKQVNAYWGIGAFGYGIKRIAEHLFILGIVVAVLALGLTVLSFFFPVIGLALSAVLGFLRRIPSMLWRK